MCVLGVKKGLVNKKEKEMKNVERERERARRGGTLKFKVKIVVFFSRV